MALASPPRNSHGAPRMDVAAARNAAETPAAAMVATTAAVAAVAMQMAVAVAMALQKKKL